MKNIFVKLLLLALCACFVLCMFACNTTPDNGGNEGENNEGGNDEGGNNGGGNENDDPAASIDWENVPLEGMPLVYNKIADSRLYIQQRADVLQSRRLRSW